MSKDLIAQLQYVKESWLKGGEGISENRLYDNIKIFIDLKVQRSLGLEKDIFSFCHERGTKKKF